MPKGKLEYHLFARFPSNVGAVRIGVFLSERKVREVGNALYLLADEVFYKVKARRADTKPYRKPLHARAQRGQRALRALTDWRSTL